MINSSLKVTGSTGRHSLPCRNDISQTCSYSISPDGKTVRISVSGYECASYSWMISIN